jgi:hypothetical protein
VRQAHLGEVELGSEAASMADNRVKGQMEASAAAPWAGSKEAETTEEAAEKEESTREASRHWFVCSGCRQ